MLSSPPSPPHSSLCLHIATPRRVRGREETNDPISRRNMSLSLSPCLRGWTKGVSMLVRHVVVSGVGKEKVEEGKKRAQEFFFPSHPLLYIPMQGKRPCKVIHLLPSPPPPSLFGLPSFSCSHSLSLSPEAEEAEDKTVTFSPPRSMPLSFSLEGGDLPLPLLLLLPK